MEEAFAKPLYKVMLSVLLQVALLMCFFCFLLAASLYSMILLLVFFIAACFISCLLAGMTLLSATLLFCEIHVCFLLLVLSFSWFNFDKQLVVKVQKTAVAPIAIFIFYMVAAFFALFDGINQPGEDTLLLGAVMFNVFELNAAPVSGTTLFGFLFLSVYALEFILLNVFVLFALFLYIAIRSFFKSTVKKNNAVAAVIKTALVRGQNQATQLLKKLAVRSFKNGRVVKNKKSKKCSKN